MEEGAWVFLDLFPNANTYYLFKVSGNNIYIKKSSDNKTLTWYASNTTWNVTNVRYEVFCVGRYDNNKYPQRKEWLITTDSTWTAPYTGNYFVELYGGGGYGGSIEYRTSTNQIFYI